MPSKTQKKYGLGKKRFEAVIRQGKFLGRELVKTLNWARRTASLPSYLRATVPDTLIIEWRKKPSMTGGKYTIVGGKRDYLIENFYKRVPAARRIVRWSDKPLHPDVYGDLAYEPGVRLLIKGQNVP